MTLSDLFYLLRHYRKIALAVFFGFALIVSAVFTLTPSKYAATSTIVAVDLSGTIPISDMLTIASDYAKESADQKIPEDSGLTYKTELGAGYAEKALTITVEAQSEEQCVHIANSIANEAAEKATQTFDELGRADEAESLNLAPLNNADDAASVLNGTVLQSDLISGRTFKYCSYVVNEAGEAEKAGFGTKILLLAIFAGGGLLTVLTMIGLDAARQPIISRKRLEREYSVPVVERETAESLGDCLWADIQFASTKPIESICIIPLGDDGIDIITDALSNAINRTDRPVEIVTLGDSISEQKESCDHVSICKCPSINNCIGAAYRAREAGASVIVADLWKNSREELDDTLHQLSLAGAAIVIVAIPALK